MEAALLQTPILRDAEAAAFAVLSGTDYSPVSNV